MPKLSTYAPTSATGLQLARLGRDRNWINVLDYGATGSEFGDDTVAIQAAVDACKLTAHTWGSKGLYFPPGGASGTGGAYICSSPIDFRPISTIRCEGWLAFNGAVTEPCFIVGQPSQETGGNHYFFGLYSLDDDYNNMRHPLIRFMGMRGGTVRIGSCNAWIEVYTEPGAYNSTLFSEFHLGQAWRLELRSPTTAVGGANGAINSNQFYGGAITQLRIGGPWVDVTSITGANVVTTTAHNFASGDMVEMYNGTQQDGCFSLITVTSATAFTLTSGSWAGSANAGNGWRTMGPAGYLHNDNDFWAPDIEDSTALIHIQGRTNRLERCRMETPDGGIIAFGPYSFMNTVEATDTQTGYTPEPRDFPMTVMDFSNGKNFYGWKQPPRPINSTQGRQPVITDATTNRTLTYGDENALIMMTSSSANTVTVPLDSAVRLAIGTRVDVVMAGTGQTSFFPAVGVTLNPSTTLNINGQYSTASAIKTATNTWLIVGKVMV